MSRNDAPVRPSVAPVQQRKLKQIEVLDAIIKRFSLQDMEVTIIFLMRVTNHVEVFGQHPRSVRRGRERFILIQEARTKIRRRSVDVGNEQGSNCGS
jgi:hypothetical protein